MKILHIHLRVWVWGVLLTLPTFNYAAAPGGVQTRSSAPGIYYEFREGYDSTPENGIGNGFFRGRGYIDNFTHPDDVMTNEDSQSISIQAWTNLTINSGGNYRVRFVDLDDDGAIFVNGTNRVTGNCCGNRESGNFSLSAGTHSLEVRWSENGGGETLRVQYLGPDTGNGWADIPSNRMNANNLNLAAWYRADSGVGNSGNGSVASGWNDSSGRGNNLGTQSGHDPRYYSSTANQLINFNPVVNFTDDRMNGPDYNNGLSIDRAGRTVIVVGAPNDTNAGFRWITGYGRDNGDRVGFGLGRNGTGAEVAVHSTGYNINNIWATNVPNAVMGIFESDRVNGGNNVQIYNKGQFSGSQRRTDWRTQLNDNADIAVGTAPDSGSGWSGRIAEVIYYPWALNTDERRRVFSYIGIKYGIHPHASMNYLTNSQGQTIFDMDDNNNGGLDWGFVAGIMRDDAASLNQRIGKSQTDFAGGLNGELTVSTDNNFTNQNSSHANTLSNGQSLVWGAKHQTISNRSANIDPNVYSRRSARYWKFTDVGGVGNVHMRFTNLPALPPGGQYVLLRDTDQNFASGTTVMATSTNGTFNNVNFPDNQTVFVAVAIRGPSVMGVAPANTMMWLRADAGVSLNSGRVASLEDRTVFDNNANTGVPGHESAFFVSGDERMNFNPSLNFDGSQDYYNFGTVGFPFGGSARTTFIVANSDIGNSGGYRFAYAYGTGTGQQAHFIGKNNATLLTGGYGGSNDISTGSYWQANRSNVIAATYTGSEARLHSAGEQVASGNRTWNTVANVAYLGRQVNGNEYFDGRIAEVIQYNKALSTTERKYVETYLALKYGVTLDATSDTYIDDDRSGALFDVDDNNDGTQDWDLVAGLFREEDAGFTQRIATAVAPQNTSLQTSLIVSGGSNFTSPNSAQSFSIGVNDYLIWGASPVPISQTTSTDFDATLYDGRFNRIWKFQDTGAVGAVNMKFQNLEQMGDGGRYFLLQSTSQNFASGYTVLGSSENGEFYNINLPNSTVRYLAVAFVRGDAAPVGEGLRVWLRGDVEYGGEGTEIKPFTSLAAASDASNGVHYFSISGTTFSTYVEDGWILVANGFASTLPNSPGYTQYTNLNLTTEGILSSSVVSSAFGDAFEVRINSTSGPAPHVDMRSRHPTVMNRFKAFDPLTYAPGENFFWKGPGAEISITCNGLGSLTSLERQIFHSCGGGGLHWIPGRGNADENTAYGNGRGNGNDLKLWARAPRFTHGDRLSLWQDRSGNRLHAGQPDEQKQPKLDSNSINFHSAVSFRGNSAIYRSASDVLDGPGDDASTIFTVVKRTAVSSGVDDIVSFTGGSITATQDRPAIGFNNNRIHATIFDGSSADRTNSIGDVLAVDQPYVMSSRIRNTTGANGVRLAVNGLGGEQLHSSGNAIDASGSALVIGAENNNLNDALFGDVAEVLIYDRELSDADYQIVNSYLALKYGITFRITGSAATSNYVNEQGNNIYDLDDNNNGGYDWIRVGAIFKSMSGSGDQRVGRSQEDGAAVTMSTDLDFANSNTDHADSLSPGQYLVWGSKAPSIDQTNTSNINTSNYAYRLARQWKVQNTGGVTGVNVFVETLPEIENDQNYVLLSSNANGNFTSAVELGRATSGTGVFANVNFPNGVSYFTVAITMSEQDGTAQKPFRSLRAVRQQAPAAGYYDFDIRDQKFNTYVDGNGWVLVASGAAASAPSAYGNTSSLSLQSDMTLPPEVFYRLRDVSEVRINSTSGPSPSIDMVSSNPLTISRLVSYQVLARTAGDQNYWTGAGASASAVLNTDGVFPLNSYIYHSNGSAGGLHWMPGRSDEHTAYTNRGGATNDGRSDLNLWVRGTDSIVSSQSGTTPYQSKLRVTEAQGIVLDFASKVALANSPLLSDFIDAGLLNVTAENLAMIVERLGQLSGEEINLVSDLQVRINAIIALEARLLNGDSQVTIEELEALGFEGITPENFATILAIIDKNALAIANGEYGLVQSLIDEYNALVALLEAIQLSNADAITVDALSAISSLSGVIENNLTWYQNVLINNQSDIANLEDIQSYIDLANALVTQLDSTEVLLTSSQWAQLGIAIEDESLLSQIVAALDGVSDLSSIQSVVDQVVEDNTTAPAMPNIFAEIPLEQFTLLGLVGITEENIGRVREALYQAYIVNQSILIANSAEEFINNLQPIIDSVVNDPLQILLAARSNGNKDAITLALLTDDLDAQNVMSSYLSIYQDLLIAMDESELISLELVQTAIDKITNHIYALIEIREDAAFNNANQLMVSIDQLNHLIGVDFIIPTLVDEYRLAISEADFALDELPGISAIQSLVAEVNDGTRNKDSDGDGITDLLETLLGFDATDSNVPVIDGTQDADNDGLTAAQEHLLGTDDLSIDSDSQHTAQFEMNNTVFDDLEDIDNDQLPNILELNLGYDPTNANEPILGGATNTDSDANGIHDTVEAFLNLLGILEVGLDVDSDADGVTDVEEVNQGTDPRKSSLTEETSTSEQTQFLSNGSHAYGLFIILIMMGWLRARRSFL